jgi:Protein of unknown function (DUF3606)
MPFSNPRVSRSKKVLTDLYTRGPRDFSRVDINEPYEVRYWTTRFGCTEQTLRAAVVEAGTMARNVEEHLRVVTWQARMSIRLQE